jgi:hypothetical protein
MSKYRRTTVLDVLTGPFMAVHALIFLLQNETMLTMAQLERN